MSKKILAIVLAGGQGTRLRPLTLKHSKPSVVFGGYRLVDFVLSNLVNSGIESIYLLAQYKPESLVEHIHANWTFAPNNDERFVSVILPRHEEGEYFYGTADAVYQNLELIERHAPDLVAVFAADQVYRMDVRQMVAYHQERNAEVTVAATQMPLEQANAFGVIVAEEQGRIRDFQEKPDHPEPLPAHPGRAYVSMGNYLFDTGVLVEGLECLLRPGESDFGRHLLPRLANNHRVYAYDFSGNRVPGLQPYEKEAYWRDIGTLDAYVDALLDVNGNKPCLKLDNSSWPVLPTLSAQRPLFGANPAQVSVAHKRRPARALSYTIIG
jgi:glucose-1-phosphate adenylyltransferase